MAYVDMHWIAHKAFLYHDYIEQSIRLNSLFCDFFSLFFETSRKQDKSNDFYQEV